MQHGYYPQYFIGGLLIQKLLMEKKIGATTYKVSVCFNDECTETFAEKTLRLAKNDLQYDEMRATMKSPQTGRLAEGELL